MTNTQKINLIDTTIYMLNDTKFKFDMLYYQLVEDDNEKFPQFMTGQQSIRCTSDTVVNSVDFHECGTTCCLAGYGALALRKKVKGVTWNDFIKKHFGVESSDDVYEFLFSGNIKQDRRDAAARVLWYLTGGDIDWDGDEKFYEELESSDLEFELRNIRAQLSA